MTTLPEITEADRAVARAIGKHGTVENADYTLAQAFACGRTGWTPTDPVLIAAREVAVEVYDDGRWLNAARYFRSGHNDGEPSVQIALAAIKLGRKLERGEG